MSKNQKKALLIMPFFSNSGGESQYRSLFMEAFFRCLTEKFDMTFDMIKSEEGEQIPTTRIFHEKINEVSFVISDLYSNNQNVAIEATISCLYGVNTYLMAPSKDQDGDTFYSAVYLQTYIGHTYDDSDIKSLMEHLEGKSTLSVEQKGDFYSNLVSDGNQVSEIFNSWYSDLPQSKMRDNKFWKVIYGHFAKIQKETYGFGAPLLDEMTQSPFIQLLRTTHLMSLESTANEIWIFANDVTIGIEIDIQSTMIENIIKGVEYRYILPDEENVKDNVIILKEQLSHSLGEENKGKISNFKVKHISRELIGQEITMLNPRESEYSAYLLDVCDDSRYLLRLNGSEAARLRTKHQRLWSFGWAVNKTGVTEPVDA